MSRSIGGVLYKIDSLWNLTMAFSIFIRELSILLICSLCICTCCVNSSTSVTLSVPERFSLGFLGVALCGSGVVGAG